MRSNNTEKIVKKIAYDNDLTVKEIFDIIKTPFEFLTQVMWNVDRDAADFPSVRVKYFATFYCSRGRRKFYKNLNKKLNGRSEDSCTGEGEC